MDSSDDEEFTLLMERFRTGDKEAAADIRERFARFVLDGVRSRLDKGLRTKFDSLDFVQEVWASFFANPPEPHAFQDQEEFIAFLTKMAYKKVAEATRKDLHRKEHNVNREHSLDRLMQDDLDQIASNEPPPSQVVSDKERWDRLLEGQPLGYQRILILLRDGNTLSEIAKEMAISRATVKHVIYQLRSRLSKERDLHRDAVPDVDLPSFTVVWDPKIVTPEEYAELVTTLGDAVRAAGGKGVQRVTERGFGVPSGKAVPT